MTVLVIVPHADDETLGMGGTIAKYTAQRRLVRVPPDSCVIITSERMVTTSSGWFDGRARA